MTPASGDDSAPDLRDTALQDTIDRLQAEGQLDTAGEGVVTRHFQARRQALEAEMHKLVPEYTLRVERDGEQAANAWLAQTAEDMGRRDADESRRVLGTVLASDE